MSWNVSFIGKPENVVAALEKYMADTPATDQSKIEYEAAKPHLIALVQNNFASKDSTYVCPTIKIEASGSGSAKMTDPPVQLQRSCTVKIEPMYIALV